MKKFIFIIVFSLVGCAYIGPNISKLNTLKPGISRTELAQYLDGNQPISTDFVDGFYLLKYDFSRSGSNYIGSVYPHYFVFDQNDKLLGWEQEKGQQKIFVSGMSIAIPFPSRK